MALLGFSLLCGRLGAQERDAYDPVKAIPGKLERQLFQAAQSGDGKKAADALAAGRVDVDATEPQGGRTALHLAALLGHQEVAELLVQRGADVNRTDKEGRTALVLAIRGAHVALAEYLLKHRAEVNLLAHDGTSPLHEAVSLNHYQLVKLLCEHHACETCADSRGISPLEQARIQGRPALMRAMGHDPDERPHVRERKLRQACIHGDEREVLRLLSAGNLDLDFSDPEAGGWTPLQEAANYGHLPVVELLVDSGAEVNRPDKEGRTALHWAATLKHLSTMAFLLKHGAKVNLPQKDGTTVLHQAVTLRHPEMVELLLKAGADPRQKDQSGASPLDLARQSGSAALAAIMDRYVK